MFEQAARLKLRFKATSGNLTVEDLFDLSLANLNNLAKSLNKKLKLDQEEDFISEAKTEDKISRLKFDIVIHIIESKKEVAAKAKAAKENKEQKQELLALIAEKDKEANKARTKEELLAELAKLEG